MTLFAAALLEKQIVIVCTNLVCFKAFGIFFKHSIPFPFGWLLVRLLSVIY